MAEAPLRVGVAFAGRRLPAWQLQCLRELRAVPGVVIPVVFEAPDPGPDAPSGSAVYRWWWRRAARSGPLMRSDPFALLADIPVVPVAGAGWRAALANQPVDVLLQLNGTGPSLEECGGIKQGVWQFRIGDGHDQGNPVPGLRELLRGDGLTRAALLVRGVAGGEPRVLREGCFRTEDHPLSGTAATILPLCASWPAQVCGALLANDRAAATGPAAGPGPENASPLGNAALLQLLWKSFRKRRWPGRQKNAPEEWNIGVLPQPLATLLDARPNLNVRWLPPPAVGQSRTTPYGWTREGTLHVLYGKFQRSAGKSVIARIRPKRDNNLKRSRTVLEATGTLTHPFLVEHEGQVHVLPEQLHAGRVDLYTLDAEGASLQFTNTLLQEPLCSPTLFPHGDRWWLLGTDPRQPDTVLQAFHAPRLEGPYVPHLLNPVKLDVRSARPGGTPFLADGALWRPARNAGIPGGGICFNRIQVLTPDRFEEEVVKCIGPLPGPWSDGIRTLSAVGGLTLMDGLRRPNGPTTKPKERRPRPSTHPS